MRKLTFCLVLLGLVFFATTSSWAIIGDLVVLHDAMYKWRGGGTVVYEFTPEVPMYYVGRPEGSDLVEIWEKVYEWDNGTGKFTWTIKNDMSDVAYAIYSFHVPYAIAAISSSNTKGWTFTEDPINGWYQWLTDSDPLYYGNTIDIELVVPTRLWGISTCGIDDINHDWYDEEGYWVASHPRIPEPGSMALLGLGLFGLGGTIVKKRFKA